MIAEIRRPCVRPCVNCRSSCLSERDSFPPGLLSQSERQAGLPPPLCSSVTGVRARAQRRAIFFFFSSNALLHHDPRVQLCRIDQARDERVRVPPRLVCRGLACPYATSETSSLSPPPDLLYLQYNSQVLLYDGSRRPPAPRRLARGGLGVFASNL
jgi:hypothetical protein